MDHVTLGKPLGTAGAKLCTGHLPPFLLLNQQC